MNRHTATIAMAQAFPMGWRPQHAFACCALKTPRKPHGMGVVALWRIENHVMAGDDEWQPLLSLMERIRLLHTLQGKPESIPQGGRMSDTVIRAAARALNPDRPIMTLAGLSHGRRSTAKSWATGHRRPSVATLKILCDLLKDRRAVLYQLIPELEYVIMLRERDPPRRTGFNEIRERDGPGSKPRDGRNQLGRPRRK